MAVPQLALTMAGAAIISAANQARNANSVLRLYKSTFNPSPTSTKADFIAAEADFDGYAAQTITAWGAPILYGQGWATFAPTATFRYTAGSGNVGNTIGGYFLVTSTGDLMTYEQFANPAPVQGPGQAVVVTPIMITSAGQM